MGEFQRNGRRSCFGPVRSIIIANFAKQNKAPPAALFWGVSRRPGKIPYILLMDFKSPCRLFKPPGSFKLLLDFLNFKISQNRLENLFFQYRRIFFNLLNAIRKFLYILIFITFQPIGYRGVKDRDNGESLFSTRGQEVGPGNSQRFFHDLRKIVRENPGLPATNLGGPIPGP